ncbi:uncharacterized protein LOC136088725 isoform X1 [Hydra vulgaris]|uniref:Uncharacterized protein LOC136088725 isoform X1 n=1 Tax=Hydra vulgaris TaxID=6087 RepID=A0ABM4D4T1_HYDVU
MAASYATNRRRVREQVDKDMEEIYGESYYQKSNVSTCSISNDCENVYYDDNAYEVDNNNDEDSFPFQIPNNQYDDDQDKCYFTSDSENESDLDSNPDEKDVVLKNESKISTNVVIIKKKIFCRHVNAAVVMAMPKAHQTKDANSKISTKLYNEEHSNVVVSLK